MLAQSKVCHRYLNILNIVKMGSSQRRKYSKLGNFGRKTGRYKRKMKASVSAAHCSPVSGNFQVRQLDRDGLCLRISRLGAGTPHLITDRHIFNVKKTIQDGKRVIISLGKTTVSSLDGYRLVDLPLLEEHINDIAIHVTSCPAALTRITADKKPYQLLKESKRYGLASILMARCLGCFHVFHFHTSRKSHFGDHKYFDVNARAVWGQMVTGGGCSTLNEVTATLDMPGISRQTFSTIESGIGYIWEECVQQEMLAAGCEERRLALERQDFDVEGIPAITVVCDGGWSKRSHKHSYNAAGGVAVIIGAVTGKLLYMGILNKNCSKCKFYESRNENPPDHKCYRNWSGSSQGMESEIIVQGFLSAERMHGVKYTRMVGDGDSSVYSRIQEEVPIWGRNVQKIECANHITKCLRTKLEQLVADNPQYKGKNMLTKVKRVRLVSCVRSMISFRSQAGLSTEKSKKSAVELLRCDIMNSAQHVFGDHRQCSDFCKVKNKGKDDNSQSSTLSQPTLTQDPEPISGFDDDVEIFQDLTDFWSEGMTQDELSAVRLIEDDLCEIDPSLHRDIKIHLKRLSDKAESLLTGATTNLAECWMSMRMKFDGGKIVNRCNRGAWNYRCYGAFLRKNMGVNWAPLAWEQATGTRAGRAFKEEYAKRDHHLQKAGIYQKKKEYKIKRWKRKMSALKQNTTKKARLEYGPDIIEESTDISKDELEDRSQFYYEKEVNVSETILQHIESQTKEQSSSGYWLDERKKRITASNFASIVKRSPTIPVHKLVEKLLYSSFTGTRITRRGLRLERFAVQEYIHHRREEGEEVVVKKMGLYVDRANPFLGASVDGHVSSKLHGNGILEIKHVLMTKIMMFEEAARKAKGFCLQNIDGMLKLKTTHPFYHQIQGQLNVLNLPWADLVVRRVDPHQLHIERVNRDTDYWTTTMLPKLSAFYTKALLPELAVPRYGKKPGIREPGVWYTDTAKRTGVKSKTQTCTKRRGRPKKQSIESTTSENETPSDVASDSMNISDIDKPDLLFLNKRIQHQWDDDFGRSKWYSGIVLQVFYGNDGDKDAVYEILYDGDNSKYEVDYTELVDDYLMGSLKFIED